jgi:meso-butanediol dehydrogenase / (S,S)-butanediol dehydrogenase / diacetyl reductase
MRLSGKTAIITGAGSGIGRAIARLFSAEGANVVIVDWNRVSGQSTADELGSLGRPVFFINADVSKAKEVQEAVEATVSKYGGLDILINDAAIQVIAELVDTSEEDWDRVHNVNLKGVFLGCKYGIPALIKSGGGTVVNIASILGFVGDPTLAAYCAAKGGVIALTKVAALTYGPARVRVNCICPGDVGTPMVEEYFNSSENPAQLRQEVYSKYALRRIADPTEIARAALFLASEDSAFMTGSTLVVDGGLTVKCY